MPDNSNVSVAVLLPCYNEEVTIGKVVRDFKAALPNADIYVYDNNSTDHTAEIATSEGAIVRKEPRQGKGNVIRAMFEDIDADVYVMSDGDDTYPADAAPAMVDKVLEGYDMVIGDRLSSTYFQENKRPFHNFGNRVARFPTLIGAVMLVIAGLLLFITGIILDVMAKNDRKAFIIDANQFAMMRRQR